MSGETQEIVRDGVPDDVVDHLVARVAELERTQLSEDVDGFLGLFRPDATWVTGGGRRLTGLDEVAEFTRSVLPGAFAQGSVRYEVELVRLLTPDVAVTGVSQTYVDEHGAETGRGLPTYVWTRVGEDWYLAVGQNTTVPTPDTATFLMQPAVTSASPSPDELATAFAVVDAVYRFGLGQDRRYEEGARELFASAFTKDATLDFRPAAVKCGIDVPLMEGRDMIVDIIMNPQTRLDTSHVVSNPRVDLDGDSAELTVLVEAQHLPTGDHSRHALLKNIYSATVVRDGGLWRMRRVHIDNLWFTGDPTVITGQ